MTHVFIGCNKIIGPRGVYFRRLSALEVTQTSGDTLSEKRLSQWRTDSPRGFAFTMRAHTGVTDPVSADGDVPELLAQFGRGQVGMLQATGAVRAAWNRTLDLAQKLSPKAILLRTPDSFMPTDINRDQLRWFAQELAPKASCAVAWEPHGLWEPDEYIPLARELGLVPVFDPFIETDAKPGHGTAYFVLRTRRGLRSSFNDFDMEDLLELCETYQRAIVIFRGKERHKDARLAHKVWKAGRAD